MHVPIRTAVRPPVATGIAASFRYLVATVYLLGSISHVYFATQDPGGYRGMSDWSPPWNPIGGWFWFDVFLAHVTVFALLLAAFELVVGLLMISTGPRRRAGIAAATAFHVALFAIFGMWPYTVPMTAALALLMRHEARRSEDRA